MGRKIGDNRSGDFQIDDGDDLSIPVEELSDPDAREPLSEPKEPLPNIVLTARK